MASTLRQLCAVSTLLLGSSVVSGHEADNKTVAATIDSEVPVTSLATGGSCTNSQWTEAYCPERCSMWGDAAVVQCLAKQGDQCGMRMEATWKMGLGTHGMTIKAAPGPGVVTTYYVSDNGGLYEKSCTKPWVELDFEIMGNQVGGHSRIWTNMLRSTCEEHWQWITVPFDVAQDYHTYAFQITESSVSFLVDGVNYRTINTSPYADVKGSALANNFQEFISVWGKSSADPGEGIPAFREAMGVLDNNHNAFPITAGFKRSSSSSPSPAPTPQPAPTPAPTPSPTPAPGGSCSGGVALWGNCLDRHCCQSGTCYAKDSHYAQCRPSCEPGIHWDEPKEYRTSW
eukprot:CAMPEP_0206429184 /NCGR_PEP_ID=MMETSP0324_2-20121206/6090_1 /ASSEMBLY_ACC=CAM_ASM_000836 /TAXON_ID=2866 /ORGANISM="Crypthecodinium cohnii, Strain Seligo" /LENGTH=342 /DNA_ID=CAMNT_0053894817 /DNA_START=46 /DNA_END=1071 /DNA_ORIENTATION=+